MANKATFLMTTRKRERGMSNYATEERTEPPHLCHNQITSKNLPPLVTSSPSLVYIISCFPSTLLPPQVGLMNLTTFVFNLDSL